MKYLKFIFAAMMLFMTSGCGMKETNAADEAAEIILEPYACDTAQIQTENNYSVSANSTDGKIILFDTESETELAAFDETYDSGGLFLSMSDENNGTLLYCSSPAAGQMMKLLYFTEDRWQTYSKKDISFQIDGYPTSLSVQSDKHLYIGTQMRSDGYLFETTDGGESWNPVIIDADIEKCRYGYAPIQDNENGIFYVLLECDGSYSLYISDDKLSKWKLSGQFSVENEVEAYFIIDGQVIIKDIQGQIYCFKKL